MKGALIGGAFAVVIALEGATFSYVVSVEHRITQLEAYARLAEPRLRPQLGHASAAGEPLAARVDAKR